MLLLDWENTFDKFMHGRLLSALARRNVAPKLIKFIQQTYNEASFFVEIDGVESKNTSKKLD